MAVAPGFLENVLILYGIWVLNICNLSEFFFSLHVILKTFFCIFVILWYVRTKIFFYATCIELHIKDIHFTENFSKIHIFS